MKKMKRKMEKKRMRNKKMQKMKILKVIISDGFTDALAFSMSKRGRCFVELQWLLLLFCSFVLNL